MDVEILHVTKGDKKRKINTSDAAEREAAKLLIESLLRKGTAVFLERGKKTYDALRIDGRITDTTQDVTAILMPMRGSKVVPPEYGPVHTCALPPATVEVEVSAS